MTTVIRYALATVCFAASVGCSALWRRSQTHRDTLIGGLIAQNQVLGFQSSSGRGSAHLIPARFAPRISWRYVDSNLKNWERSNNDEFTKTHGSFAVTHGGDGSGYYFPLWYPALVFALAGVAALRFRRQFTIRSAIVATAVVAIMLGIVVAL